MITFFQVCRVCLQEAGKRSQLWRMLEHEGSTAPRDPKKSEGVVGCIRARHQRHRTAAEPKCRLDHTQARRTEEMHADVAVCCKLLMIEITDYTLTKFGLVEIFGF